MNPGDSGSVVCPTCAAENFPGSSHCFLCDQSLGGATRFIPPKPASETAATGHPTFRIHSMMLLIALIAVFLGVFHEAPGIAMLLAVPGAIALARTLTYPGDRQGPPSALDHVGVFLVTFVAVVAVAVAAGVSFFVTCLAIVATGTGPYGGNNFGAGLIVGGIVGVAVLIGLTRVFFRRSRRRPLR